MKKILNHLYEHKTLTRAEACSVLTRMASGEFNDSEITSFITVYLMRSITIDELLGYRDALLALCNKVDLGTHELIDIVGTGGDGKDTFNISTLSCFIVAGAGHQVAKHGNYGASSISGSSNVLEQLGYTFKTDETALKQELETANICFLHAPLFHPALRIVGPIRKQLKVRTFFNMLGPLVNPAFPKYQLIGVYSAEMARIYNYLLQQTDQQFTLVNSMEGYDEISLTGDTRIINRLGENIFSAIQLGKRLVFENDIHGGNSVEAAANIFLKILKGEGSWSQNAVVMANAAMALHCTGKYNSYDDCFQMAVESLESGKALQTFKKLIP
ncbi:MAG: anthranilate phosphoribosyltransferase [Ferruginibacter sp.]